MAVRIVNLFKIINIDQYKDAALVQFHTVPDFLIEMASRVELCQTVCLAQHQIRYGERGMPDQRLKQLKHLKRKGADIFFQHDDKSFVFIIFQHRNAH